MKYSQSKIFVFHPYIFARCHIAALSVDLFRGNIEERMFIFFKIKNNGRLRSIMAVLAIIEIDCNVCHMTG